MPGCKSGNFYNKTRHFIIFFLKPKYADFLLKKQISLSFLSLIRFIINSSCVWILYHVHVIMKHHSATDVSCVIMKGEIKSWHSWHSGTVTPISYRSVYPSGRFVGAGVNTTIALPSVTNVCLETVVSARLHSLPLERWFICSVTHRAKQQPYIYITAAPFGGVWRQLHLLIIYT